ncbi:tRNA (adenosine(37)-N6)-threonylcarbamoyltransferase complex transferase subunit TsaD [Candidatus Beckwithbacteria bacterium RBG_13_42_9]|uniref:tRNA N6-adenosine threonylcarbamoyltransferase n=1 Tax=Candidatus Beckwithbacteria bacterium RBG_13_42_9 TaxID=1797457 RepID=A0A1F5E3G6_9BACT|nr:MAG: tRNA (adenosine(37)-N6)-threonylcarbamoyltransferase complex transferase subunit TsaD [Candidatus Beckwithbacteria bacterium RBG_13_42_9]
MRILAIETSCDETSAAVIEDGQKILANVITSSEKLQQRFGGIIPEQAAREQLKCILPVIDEALTEAKVKLTDLDAIAATYGPGLIGSLIIGLETAKTLSFAADIPLIPVNHLLGHIYANFLERLSCHSEPRCYTGIEESLPFFPAICLVVSGGHTDLLLMTADHYFKWLGGTRDDAAGECFDKSARLLGLGYPGGPAIEKAVASCKQQVTRKQKLETCNLKLATLKLPRPMINDNNFDFSFSGLKTAVLSLVLSQNGVRHPGIPVGLQNDIRNSIAYELQEAITDVLVAKTLKAAEKYQAKSILVGGGVAANKRLREKLKTQSVKLKTKLFIPDFSLCTDNAAVIAAAAFYQNHPADWRGLKPNPSLHFG